MVIVLKYNVLYVASQGIWQEMDVVHYETYIDHQVATENKDVMYINNKRLEEVDQRRELDLLSRTSLVAEVDVTENESVVERRGDLRAWTHPCGMTMSLKMMKKEN